jgi:hypothetical protein
LDLEL